MMPQSEVSELIADVRKQVIFLRDLGVDALEVELREGRIASVGSDKWVVESVRREPPVAAPRTSFAPTHP